MTPDSIKGRYTKAAIRADSSAKAEVDKKVTKERWTTAKTGLEARKAKVAAAKDRSNPEVEPPDDSVLKMAGIRSRKPGKKV